MADASAAKLSIPAFVKMLTANGVSPSKAMAVTGKIYKTHNTPQALGFLTDASLQDAGVDEKDLRKSVLAAVRKAGYKSSPRAGARPSASNGASGHAGPSNALMKDVKPKNKRKRDADLNELLPDKPRQEGDHYGSLEFHETLDEKTLQAKSTVINRAPIMMAWAFVVAERLGFRREEALSIASVYTEMNAVTKGVSLGLYADSKREGMEASRTGSQPYVELMGRRPLYQTASSEWRALSQGSPVAPTSAFSYITRSLRQTTPHILGALRLLAASFPPAVLNAKGFGLYAEFRPTADGWGQRGEVRCATILGLRRPPQGGDEGVEAGSIEDIVKTEPLERPISGEPGGEPDAKRRRKTHPELMDEYDAALEDDELFSGIDLEGLP